MKIKDIRNMDNESLDKKLSELRKELVKINAQVAIGTTPKNPGQVKAIKKTVARLMTVMHEKKSKPGSQDKQNKKNSEVEKKA